ncbi:putative conserved hypothetical protein [Methanothermobacter sp. MT-2]|nr:putative conserved hypothetical protein [Methanothermobacter sp. MT-2]
MILIPPIFGKSIHRHDNRTHEKSTLKHSLNAKIVGSTYAKAVEYNAMKNILIKHIISEKIV